MNLTELALSGCLVGCAISFWYSLLYICQSFLLLKPFLCRTRAVGNRDQTRFCWVPDPLKLVLRGWCYKIASFPALCNSMHKPTGGGGVWNALYVCALCKGISPWCIDLLRCGFISSSAWSCNYQVFSAEQNYCILLQSCKFCGLSRQSMITGAPIQYQVRPYGVFGGQIGTQTGFTLGTAVFFRSGSSLQCSILVFL